MNKALLLLAPLGVALAAPASAAVFDFSYTYQQTRAAGAGTVTVIGQLIGDQIAGTSQYQITGITGTRTVDTAVGPFTITGLAAVGSFGGNDNILTLFAPRDASAPSYLTPDANGIAFTEVQGPSPVRIFSTPANQRTGMAQENYNSTTSNAFSITVTPAVPEPASWAMIIAGFGLAGAAMRRRSVAVRFA